MRAVDTRMVMGLAVWVLGFALMAAGWLIGVLFEEWGQIPSKVLYKLGATLVALPVIILLWKVASALYVNRVDIALQVNEALRFISEAAKGL